MTEFEPLRQPRLISFDCYGTLIDWDTPLRARMEAVLEEKGIEVDRASFYRAWYFDHALPALNGPFLMYRELLRQTFRAALTAAGAQLSPADGTELGDVMAAAEPFSDVTAVLARLRERFVLATISNSEHSIIRHSVLKLGDPFEHVLTGEDVRAYKPHPALFERVLADAGVTAADTLHIAQSQYVDLPRSLPMGIPTIWVNRQGQTLEPGVPAPTRELRDLGPVPALLGLEGDSDEHGAVA